MVVYPEGTITRQPDLWPMTGKTGAARIALASGVPVIPVAQWGANHILAPYGKRPRAAAPQDDPRERRAARRPRRPPGAAAHPRGAAARRPTGSWTTSRALLEEIRGEQAPARAVRPAHGRRAPDRQPARARSPTPEQETAHEQGGGVRRRLVGYGVLRRARRRRQRRDVVGTPRGALRDDQREAREHRLPARASSCRRPSAPPTTRSRRWTAPRSVFFAVPSQTFRGEPRGLGRHHPAGRRCWSR